MSLIEQAARRLEELKRAGIVLPPGVAAPAAGSPGTIAQAMARVGQVPPPPALGALSPQGAANATDQPPPATPTAQAAAAVGAAAALAALGTLAAPPSVPAAAQTTPPATPWPGHGQPQPVPNEAAASTPADEPAVPAQQRRSREVRIDLERLASHGYLVPGQNRTALAEQMRIIKRPLLANARGEGPEPVARANLIQVVSALPGEGKTFVAMNLAMSIAMEVDHSVLLVDADVLRPSVPERCGLDSAPGLLDVLSNPKLDLADVMLRTNVPKLSLLPAGTASLKSTELLASDAMARLLDELAAKYTDRIIVFDAPPLIPTTESRVLASRMGQVVMVVEADATSRGQAAQAFAALEDCPVVLSVLNKSHQRSSEAYGYYYAA
ncbi:MAG: hypothetical protein RIQ60_2621 [Pseudomonadota bacterium]|jgi:receptor protein-tyrosine kinase